MYEETRALFRDLKAPDRETRDGDCPPETEWVSVAAGVPDPADAISLMEHAARCPACGPLLQAAVEDVSDLATADEMEMLSSLPSSGAAGQAAIAETLRQQTSSARSSAKRFVMWRRFGMATAAALFLAAGAFATRRFWYAPAPSELIAQSYTESRTLELRIPGAAYAATKVQRGGDTSNLDRPGSLLRAESLIADGLKKRPGDPTLLDAEARADLLDGNDEHAMEIAQRALEADPNSVPLLLDLSTAYFLRAEQNGNDEHDYALAIEYLGRVLSKTPDDPVALFNRAVCEQRAYLYDRAVEDWKRFLQVERDPAWLADGKRQYDALLTQMARPKQSNIAPDQELPQLSHSLRVHTGLGDDPGWSATRDEAYINLALEKWLAVVATPDSTRSEQLSESQDALGALAQELSSKHRDLWLVDLVDAPHSQQWLEGARELSTAARLMAEGEARQSSVHAQKSLDEFQRDRNAAGSAAAAFMLTRSLSNSQMGSKCLPPALVGLRAVNGHRYPWLATRVLYELSTCSSLQGNPAQAEQYAQRGEASAEAAGYPVLTLVGRFFLDGVASRAVAEAESWNRMRAGLRDFWSSDYPASCAAAFFVDMDFAAKTEHLWNFAEAAGQEAVLMNSLGRSRTVQAASHSSLAQAALAAGDAKLADAEFQTAAEMFASGGKGLQTARVTLEIQRASFELRQGWLEKARARLKEVQSLLPSVDDQSTETLYRETLGELYLRSGKPELAEEQLVEAIRLIEMGKNTLSSETEFLTWQLDKAQTYRLLLEIYSTRAGADARSLAFLEWYQAEPLRVQAKSVKTSTSDPLGQPMLPAVEDEAFAKGLAKVAPQDPVLVWASFPSELVIWELDRTGVHRVRVDVGARLLNATAARFARMCADPSSDATALHHDAHQLYAWLIEPVVNHLPNSGTLTIEPDVALRSVPFAALEGPGNRYRYLGDRFSISESPGLLYSRVLRPDRSITPQTVALSIGDPSFGSAIRGSHLRRLPDADREAREVSARFEHHYLLQGREATRDNVVNLLPRAELFHFAGHAFTRGRDAGLLLASGSDDTGVLPLLGRNDLISEDLRSLQIAVLSGCETAMADQGMVDPGSLVRIFLRSGVPHVIASKWRVDSGVSADTMGNFYTQLLRGQSVTSALAESERMIRSNPATAHPYYWAAFSSFGA